MLRKIFKRWQSKAEDSETSSQSKGLKPVIIPRSEHGISRNDISENALKVLYRLKKHGYEAYLVGGGVRDILLGYHPKDFDLATDASPEQIRQIFNNCRLIGRRFRLAHVYFGRDIIEVATFRGGAENKEITSEKGMLLRDNVYGTLEEDIWRRDFTMNALYYNIKDFSVVDFCGGVKDLKKKILRIIGSPSERFREDPVRMLRAIRLSCKLDLKLAKDLPPAIKSQHSLISHVPEARLYEEVLKLFHCGHGEKVLDALLEHQLFFQLFPYLEHVQDLNKCLKLIKRVLANTDARLKEGKSVNPAFIFSALLYYPMKEKIPDFQKDGSGEFPATLQASSWALNQQRKRISLPKRVSLIATEIWMTQIRLTRLSPGRVEKVMRDQRFRAAYDFLLLRGEVGEDKESADWWYQYVEGDAQYRNKALNNLSGHSKKRRKRKPKSKSKSVTKASDSTSQ